MDDDKLRLIEKIQDLNDIELAVLCCVVAGEHCVILAEDASLDTVAEELQEVDLSYALFGSVLDLMFR